MGGGLFPPPNFSAMYFDVGTVAMPKFMRVLTGLLTILASSEAHAREEVASSSSVCSGVVAMSNDHPEGRTTIVRSGIGHTATVSQHDSQGTLHLEQHGQDHAVIAVQSGNGDRLVIDQQGTSAQADVAQSGTCNDTALTQLGEGNDAQVRQSGNGNRAVIRQGPTRE